MPRSIHHVCLDKDGTLIDLHPYCRHLTEFRARALRRRFQLQSSGERGLIDAMGVTPETGRVKPGGPVGYGPRNDVVAAVEGYLSNAGVTFGVLDVTMLFAEVDELQQARNDFAVELLPGVREYLEWLAVERIPATVFSSDRKENTRRVLTIAGIHQLIAGVVGGGCVTRSKPHPEGFFRACELAQVPASSTAYIGDTALDISVARNGGAALGIGVTTGLADRVALLAVADRVFGRLDELIGFDSQVYG
jgi:phosphoglycolate phosphatase